MDERREGGAVTSYMFMLVISKITAVVVNVNIITLSLTMDSTKCGVIMIRTSARTHVVMIVKDSKEVSAEENSVSHIPGTGG